MAGSDGIGEAFGLVRPNDVWADRRLSPLLRLTSPELVPHMNGLLGTRVDALARTWLEMSG